MPPPLQSNQRSVLYTDLMTQTTSLYSEESEGTWASLRSTCFVWKGEVHCFCCWENSRLHMRKKWVLLRIPIAEQVYLTSIIQIFWHLCPLPTTKHIVSKVDIVILSQCIYSVIFGSEISKHNSMYKAIKSHLCKGHTSVLFSLCYTQYCLLLLLYISKTKHVQRLAHNSSFNNSTY